ncbi:hypothetical protein B0T21DRAFT_349475 [Apiosordaria backusii]|uniref:Uncharacterized protein n=1 Tax=Apiosordaria backusii TaxID=314023 RepID=A0AA40ECK9_9PEZI|nr:hypothetical protein B0T21DRAFT_349475 [Apiosordaria backusii]
MRSNQTRPSVKKQRPTSTMSNGVECPWRQKALKPRSLYQHEKICRRNPEREVLHKCTLPVFAGNPANICNTLHRNKTALRDHRQTCHFDFKSDEPGYDRRDSTDRNFLARFSNAVLTSRVTVEGRQLLEHKDAVENAELAQKLSIWVYDETKGTKKVLVTRLRMIREERQRLGLEILD